MAILNGFGAANVEEEEAGGKDSRRKQQSKKKKETPVEATRRKREQQQRVRSAFQKALSAEIDRRKAEVGGKLSLRLCWGAYRDVSKEFFGTGGDAAAAARARLRVEGLGGGDREEDGELVAGGELCM